MTKNFEESIIGALKLRQTEMSPTTLDKNYDLVISTISWGSRFPITIPYIAGKSDDIKLLRFESTSVEMEEKKNINQALAERNLGDSPRFVKMQKSVKSQENFKLLAGLIDDKTRQTGHSLRILVDCTCMPKRYMLFLLGKGFKTGQAAKIDFIYAEAKQYQSTTSGTFSLISEGEWTSVQVPYLEGAEYVPDARDLFISMGGELTSAMPLVERFEPKELRLYHVEEKGERMSPEQLAGEAAIRNKLISFSNSFSSSFALWDVAGLAEEVLRAQSRATTCFAIGPKPHALAFGLASLAKEDIQVVCRAPASYLPNDAVPSGRLFAFQIEDRFDPRAYWTA